MIKNPFVLNVFALVLLVSCTEAPDAPASSESDASQESTASPVSAIETNQSPYPARYVELEPLIRMQMKGVESLVSHISIDGAPAFDMYDCYEFGKFETQGNIDYIDKGYEYIARRARIWRNTFEKYGYDKAIYSEELQKFELTMIAFVDQSAKSENQKDEYGFMIYEEKFNEMMPALAAQIEAKRQATQPDKQPIVSEGGCGDGESPTLVNITPKGARLWLIEDFDFNVCAIRVSDPWNRNRCQRWWEVNTAEPAYLSGSYRYQAVWPGGRGTRGQTQVQPGKNENDPAKIKITQP